MRDLTLVLLCITLCGNFPAWAATAHQQQFNSITGNGGEPTKNLSYLSAVGAGSLLVAVCGVLQDAFSTTPATFSDGVNSWTTVLNQGVDDPELLQVRVYLGYAVSTSGGSTTVTCDPPGTNYITLVLIEYTGMLTSGVLDRSVSASSDAAVSTTPTTGTTALATTQAEEVVVAATVILASDGDRTITEQAPCTLVAESEDWDTTQPMNVCDYAVSSMGTQQANWTVSGADLYWAGGLMTFKVAPVVTGKRRLRNVYP